MDTQIRDFTFDSKKPGPTLVVTGLVHGDEKCGMQALNRLKLMMEPSGIALMAGRLIMVPIVNPGAYALGKRFVDRNLNRRLFPKTEAEQTCYEDKLDNQICAVLDKADFLLDLHSNNAGGAPFVFLGGRSAEEKAFGEALGVTNNFVWGWRDAFNNASIPPKELQGMTEYTRSTGGLAVTLECGHHLDPKAPGVGYAATLNAMAHLGLIAAWEAKQSIYSHALPAQGPRQFAKMLTVVRNDPTKLAKAFGPFEPVKAGALLAVSEKAGEIYAPADGYIILPNPKAVAGAEMVYLGIEEEPRPPSAPVKIKARTL